MNIKKWLKRILPVSYLKVEFLAEELKSGMEENNRNMHMLIKYMVELQEAQDKLANALLELGNKLPEAETGMYSHLENMRQKLEIEFCTAKEQILRNTEDIIRLSDKANTLPMNNELKKNLTDILLQQKNMDKLLRENLWSAIFNDTIHDSSWLVNQSFSPGRWAMGYPALYLLYRVLNDFLPHSILELGLGQSTSMTMQYTKSHEDIVHFVVEHDRNWVDFYSRSNEIATDTHIVILEREIVPYKDSSEVRVFKDFKKTFEGYKFDLIIVDAPLGGDMTKYARIDILSILDKSLCDEFILILDDVNRFPERNTMKEISRQLDLNGVKYSTKIYSGEKETCIWATPCWSFLCSL